MVYTGTLTTEAELDAKAGELVDVTGWTEANKNAWVAQAEGFLHLATKYDWVTNYASLGTSIKGALSEWVSNQVAIYGILYNMESGYGSNITAEDQINYFWARNQELQKYLLDPDFRKSFEV